MVLRELGIGRKLEWPAHKAGIMGRHFAGSFTLGPVLEPVGDLLEYDFIQYNTKTCPRDSGTSFGSLTVVWVIRWMVKRVGLHTCSVATAKSSWGPGTDPVFVKVPLPIYQKVLNGDNVPGWQGTQNAILYGPCASRPVAEASTVGGGSITENWTFLEIRGGHESPRHRAVDLVTPEVKAMTVWQGGQSEKRCTSNKKKNRWKQAIKMSQNTIYASMNIKKSFFFLFFWNYA